MTLQKTLAQLFGKNRIYLRCILRLICIVHAVLEQMKGHAKAREAELFIQSKFFEPEEVFLEIGCEVPANELLAAVIEGTDTVRSSVNIQGGTLRKSVNKSKRPRNMR
jgi:hypothetical protein